MSRMCLFSPDYLIAEQESKVPDDQDANFYPYLLVSTRDGHLDSLDYVQKKIFSSSLLSMRKTIHTLIFWNPL